MKMAEVALSSLVNLCWGYVIWSFIDDFHVKLQIVLCILYILCASLYLNVIG